MAAGLPDLSVFCRPLPFGPGELCIPLPGGAKVCASDGHDFGDPYTIVKSLLGNVNTALAPLIPFFQIIEALKAIMDCVTAIPDALGPPPDPTKIAACIPQLTEKVGALLALLPQVSIPVTIKATLDAIIQGLLGLKLKLQAILNQVARLAASALRASQLNNPTLAIMVDCATNDLEALLFNLNMDMRPINRLILLINLLLDLAGLPCVPTLADISGLTADALAPLDAAIAFLQKISATLGGDFILDALPGPDEPCGA